MNAALSMKILALEFSSSQRGVAVTEGNSMLRTVATDNLKTSPLSLINEALQKARLDRATIEDWSDRSNWQWRRQVGLTRTASARGMLRAA